MTAGGGERGGSGESSEVAVLRAEVDRLRRHVDALAGQITAGTDPGGRFDALYPAFQDRFRGSEADVRVRLRPYLSDVARAGTGRGTLDVGPGRGEWLGLLAERGLPAYVVEASASMAAVLRSRGLPVVHADALEHLRGLEPGSLDAISAFHVVEHLDLDTLLGLLAAARDALRPGGLLILETPNPTNLVMAACNFRFDPTHRQPLPPALTEFLLIATGFRDIEVRLLHPKEPVDLHGLRLHGVDDQTTALLARALTTALFGPQDYATLACAPPAAKEPA